jgi:hypothetical protein
MPQVGSRTTSTDLWLVGEDVAALDAAVREVAGASWRCSQPGPAEARQVHLHPTLPDAIECGGGVQAFLPLPLGTGLSEGLALVQYLHTSRLPDDALGRMGDHLRAGWLAVRWFTGEVGDAEPLLTKQKRAVWAAMRSVTRPCLLRHLHTGDAHKSARMGPAAKRLAQEHGLTLALRSQPYRLDEGSG